MRQKGGRGRDGEGKRKKTGGEEVRKWGEEEKEKGRCGKDGRGADRSRQGYRLTKTKVLRAGMV